MSQLIATVSGKAVYSDKQLLSVVDTRVTFTDGSWCDVSTGEVVNNGKGYINIGVPSTSDDEQTTFGPKTYLATTLDVQGVEADVNIEPINGTQMTVTIVGSKSAVEDISTRLQGDMLTIQSKGDGGTRIRSAYVVISGRGAVAIGRDMVTISGGDSGSNTKITIGVPKGSAVNVAGVQGNVTIGDTDGRLQASVFGGDDIKAGKVRDATLAVQGSGNISVTVVNGNLSMTIQGSGDIRVRGGFVESLMVNVMGSGDAKFNGEAVNANLSVMGSGDIDVTLVKNKPVKNAMGSGNIIVGNW